MVSWGSNVDSDGVPVDHDGEQLEDTLGFDGLRGSFLCVESVMRELLGANPQFEGDANQGESSPKVCDFGAGLVDDDGLQMDAKSTSVGATSVDKCEKEVDEGEKQVDQGEKLGDEEGNEAVEDVDVGSSTAKKRERVGKLSVKRKACVFGQAQEEHQGDTVFDVVGDVAMPSPSEEKEDDVMSE